MRNVLKLIALLTMVIDHVGAVLYPNIIVLRMIGRISFPIFAYLLALGYKSTHDAKKYLKRLLLFGLLSEIPYILAFNSDNLNIFFTLALGSNGGNPLQFIGEMKASF
ncbi:TraX family protein [Thermoanaerobacterium sp. RBIITD]|uniref:TraX family protein n=1 Tax=Thermoanaerobacterium sp. RBIITD TaxID=1550240 RepID=UPI000BB795CE|nr:TraX family protein [Thermoanaerobacterium sp. RBIITD]SNX54090.1 TraX protein [Thermoanaerobacterium sp. RBIITD]